MPGEAAWWAEQARVAAGEVLVPAEGAPTREELLLAVVQAQARAGDIEAAKATAAAMSEGLPKLAAHAAIVEAHAADGDVEIARAFASRHGVADFEMGTLLVMAAMRRDEAAEQLEPSLARLPVATGLARAGRAAEASAAAAEIVHSGIRAVAFGRAAAHLAKRGVADDAREMINSAAEALASDDTDATFGALVVTSLFSARQFDLIEEFARRRGESADELEQAFVALADIYSVARGGDVERAKAMALDAARKGERDSHDASRLFPALGVIVAARADAGSIEEARALAETGVREFLADKRISYRVDDNQGFGDMRRSYGTMYQSIAAAMAESGDWQAARTVAGGIALTEMRGKAYRAIARHHAAQGDHESLRGWLDGLGYAGDRAFAFLGAYEGIMGIDEGE